MQSVAIQDTVIGHHNNIMHYNKLLYNILYYYYMHATIEGKHRNVLAGCRLATKSVFNYRDK